MGKQYKALQDTLNGQQERTSCCQRSPSSDKLKNHVPDYFVALPPGLKGKGAGLRS